MITPSNYRQINQKIWDYDPTLGCYLNSPLGDIKAALHGQHEPRKKSILTFSDCNGWDVRPLWESKQQQKKHNIAQ